MRAGGVVGALSVKEHEEIMLITFGGQMVRIAVASIREAGRNTMGVKLIDLDTGDRLQAIASVISDEEKTDPQDPAAAPVEPVEPPPEA